MAYTERKWGFVGYRDRWDVFNPEFLLSVRDIQQFLQCQLGNLLFSRGALRMD
jgi:hypothetical protein